MNPFQKKTAPPALSTPGAKPKAAAEEALVISSKPDVPTEPATEPGKVVISPEMVCFRTADEVCRTCDHYGQDGMCSVLNMQTEPQDGCNAFAEREDGASDIEPAGGEAMEMEAQ